MTLEELVEVCNRMIQRGQSDWRVIFVGPGGEAYFVEELADGDLGEFTLRGTEYAV